MLALPAKGFSRSVKAHNVDIGICCDWLEASCLFLQEEISDAEIIDVLREGEIYATQDFAWEFVQDVFSALRSRSFLMGAGYPVEVKGANRIKPKGEVAEFGAYAFCLTLSLPHLYPKWSRAFGTSYTLQGELFEQLTAESVGRSLSGWKVHPTGWSRTNPVKLTGVVKNVAALLGEPIGDIARWTKERAKEAGLDLLCFRPFHDGRVGVPVYLVQCASGADWRDKLRTPDLKVWTKLIPFAADPKKAFSMPFALQESDFVMHTNVVDGLLLDRHRLLVPGEADREWVSPALNAELVNWVNSRIASLPKLEPAAA